MRTTTKKHSKWEKIFYAKSSGGGGDGGGDTCDLSRLWRHTSAASRTNTCFATESEASTRRKRPKWKFHFWRSEDAAGAALEHYDVTRAHTHKCLRSLERGDLKETWPRQQLHEVADLIDFGSRLTTEGTKQVFAIGTNAFYKTNSKFHLQNLIKFPKQKPKSNFYLLTSSVWLIVKNVSHLNNP